MNADAMNPLIIEPTDLLFFRDAIPMSAGQGKGAGCRLPFPSTLHEALRTSLLTARSAPGDAGQPVTALPTGKDFTGRDGKKVASFAFQSLRTVGPFPWQEFDADDLSTRRPRGLLLPVPLDVAFDEKREHLARMALRHESVQPGLAVTPENFRPFCLPVSVTPPDKHAQLHGWWTLDQWRAYLEGRTDNGGGFFHPVPQDELWESEHRVGVEIEPETFSARSGQLYAGSYLRPNARTRFAARVQLQKPVNEEAESLSQLSWLLLGGEQRLARLHHEGFADPFANLPPAPEPKAEGVCLLKWVLLTPAIFMHGSLPGWCIDTKRDRFGGPLPAGQVCLELAGRAQLVSWRLGKPRTVSGWDVVEGRAKPTMLAVPEGGVYYFLCENRATATALAMKLHWQPRSDFYGEKGCGYGLVSFDVRMHASSIQIEELAREVFQ
jgi:CRISPR-associated protein Cmr3